MKKLVLFLISFFVLATPTFGQTPSGSSIPTSNNLEKINEKVDELKNKIASRVAQLNLVEKRGIIGTVQNASDTQITIADLNGKNRIIDVDEFTKFSSGDNDSFGISDIEKGTKISVLGLYNKESARLLARFINEVTIPLFLYGVVSEIDEENFTITLTTEDGNEYMVDVEKITKTFEYSDGELDTSGFSKIEILQNALVIGFADHKEEKRVTGSRVVILPDVPKNPKIPVVIEPTSSPTPTKNLQRNKDE